MLDIDILLCFTNISKLKIYDFYLFIFSYIFLYSLVLYIIVYDHI